VAGWVSVAARRRLTPNALGVLLTSEVPMPRDNFARAVVETLARRVGLRCSNPGCGKPTAGPRSEPSAAVNIGVGAHITAAAAGGPRFDPTLTRAQRRSEENGIWLCQNCAKLIDNDPSHYRADILRQWKQMAEDTARAQLEQVSQQVTPEEHAERRAYRRRLIESWRVAIEAEKYDFIDYRSTFLSSAIYSSMLPHLAPAVVRMIEAPRTIYVGGGRGDFLRKYTLLDEVARIERLWGLV
jgi:hypothetical protein